MQPPILTDGPASFADGAAQVTTAQEAGAGHGCLLTGGPLLQPAPDGRSVLFLHGKGGVEGSLVTSIAETHAVPVPAWLREAVKHLV